LSGYFDMTQADLRSTGLAAAKNAVGDDQLVVVPTDTTYGIGCDAFSPVAVGDLRRARGAGRSRAPAVLVPHVRTLAGIASGVSASVMSLAEAFWPGALTLICSCQPTLTWDLGDTGGTVAVRMPLHPVALELLDRTGPMAVTGANRVGEPAAISAWQAQQQFGEAVAVYLDAGPCGTGVPSTVIDGTHDVPRLLRLGGVGVDDLLDVVPDLLVNDLRVNDLVRPDLLGPDDAERPG
jgi:L-threonylcarbamoyladenylate synthase